MDGSAGDSVEPDSRLGANKKEVKLPSNIRRILSVIVALVAAVAFYFEHQAGYELLKWLTLALGAFMIYAVWLFPEAKRSKNGEA